MWSVSHEAISLGDPDLVAEITKYRDFQRSCKATTSTKAILAALLDTADFYCEMSWEFSSWVPFVKRMCPSDTYRIYKQGSNVRIDTTLVGFDANSWKRGNMSYVFSLSDEGHPQIVIMDHESSTATKQTLYDHTDEELDEFAPTPAETEFRLTNPTSTTYVDVDNIGFERTKAGGFLSWLSSSDKTEKVDDHECKVFNASNVHLITKTRTEHLSEEDKTRIKEEQSSNSLSSILNYVRSENVHETKTQDVNETGLTAYEYLDASFPLDADIGRPKEVAIKSNSFKAVLWLAEEYALSLQEQVIPIVELMSASNAHFARLQNFMRMQLPAGFPVKIEIPLFHVVSANITFGNVNEPGQFVTVLDYSPEGKVESISIDETVFHVPSNYRVVDETSPYLWWPDETESGGRDGRMSSQQQDEILLQLAIQQSIRDARGDQSIMLNDYGVALRDFAVDAGLPGYAESEDVELARAIEESLRLSGGQAAPPFEVEEEDDLTKALRLSAEEDARRAADQEEEEEELKRILELSKTDK